MNSSKPEFATNVIVATLSASISTVISFMSNNFFQGTFQPFQFYKSSSKCAETNSFFTW